MTRGEQNNNLTFEECYIRYYQQVYMYIYKRIMNTQIAEDLTMDVFAACLENFKKFDSQKASFQTWLYVIVQNKLKNYYRDKKEIQELDDNQKITYQDEMIEAMYLTFLRNHLALALAELSETHRKIVIYKYFQGKKSTEIAYLIGTSSVNVRVQLKRAIDKLKEYFMKNNIRWE